MKINGFQKLTLLDFPEHTACTVFTGGCNYRCPFCHNALLVTEADELEVYPEDFVLSYLDKRKKVLDGVAITGGEPLMQSDIMDFIRKIRDRGFEVKLDTNGTFPDLLKEILDEGLVDYVAVDIKNSPEKYAVTAGVKNAMTDKISKTIGILINGQIPYEFRTTVVDEFHTVEDIGKIGQWIQGAEHYYLQKFVDSGGLIGEGMTGVSKAGMLEMLEEARKYVKCAELRGVD